MASPGFAATNALHRSYKGEAPRRALRSWDKSADDPDQHFFSIAAPISAGSEKITDARSPIMPARVSTGLPFAGPLSLESVLKRRLNSQNGIVSPAAVEIGRAHV